MANYHVLGSNELRDKVTIAMHIAIPAANNAVAFSYRTALKQMLEKQIGGPITSAVPFILAGELTQLQNGEIYELVETVEVDANLTDNQKLALLDAHYTATNAAVLTRLQNVLKYWGYDRNVP